jgi:PAS domain S-box-containing protein
MTNPYIIKNADDEEMTNPYIVENTVSHEKIFKHMPVDEEMFVKDAVMISETDTKGIIIYTNRHFREISGFSKEELIGSPHSINRHPDMPKGVFKAMWKIISTKKVWRGYVKNMRKDGKFYWTLVYIQAKLDENAEIIGFIASRKIAYPDSIKEVEEIYVKYHGDEHIDNHIFMGSEGYQDYLDAQS